MVTSPADYLRDAILTVATMPHLCDPGTNERTLMTAVARSVRADLEKVLAAIEKQEVKK